MVAEVDLSFVSAEFLYFVQDVDPATIDLIAFLVTDGPGQLDGGNAAEYLAAGACLRSNL